MVDRAVVAWVLKNCYYYNFYGIFKKFITTSSCPKLEVMTEFHHITADSIPTSSKKGSERGLESVVMRWL
jgi:hypothetical protein